MGINFKGVAEAQANNITPWGVVDVFTIKSVEFNPSKKKGTLGMDVVFEREQDSFKHTFYLSEKALPRVVHLVKHAVGKDLDDDLSEEQLKAMLTGRKVGIKTSAKIDTDNGKAYTDLSFGGFACAPSEISTLKLNNSEQSLCKEAENIRNSGSRNDADSASGSGKSTPPAGSPAKTDDDPF
jgi:hypothetical protein